MTTHPESFTDEGLQWAWDSTSLKRAQTCPRYYQYKALESWESPYDSVHLWFGRIYASALEMFHELEAKGSSREDAIEEVVRWALLETWEHELDDDDNPIEGTGGPTQFEHTAKSRDTLIRTIIWYFAFFEEDYFSTYIKADGTPAVEHSFRIAIDNDITLCGHKDRLCVDPQGELFVHDQKTTGTTLSPYYFKQFKPDIQFSLYTFAGRMIYNAPVKGVIVDAAQVAVGFTRFARSPIMQTDDELDEWYEEMILLVDRTHAYQRAGFFPRDTTACHNFGGCDFREVCSRPKSVRKNFLEADFRKGPRWNPIIPR